MSKKQSTGSVTSEQEAPENGEVERKGEEEKEVIVQYIIVRNDVYRNQERSFNTILQHTSSAATSMIQKHYHHKYTRDYLKDGDDMRKKIFQVKDEKELSDLSNKLTLNNIDFKVWIKQPGNYATCIATRPYPVTEISQHFKNVKIYKK